MKHSFVWIKIFISFGYLRSYAASDPSPGQNLQSLGSTGQNKVAPEPSPQIDSQKSPPPPPTKVLKYWAPDRVEDENNNMTVINVDSTPTAAERSQDSTAGVKSAADADSQKDFKRVGKMAFSGTLAVVSVSVALLMSRPRSIDLDHIILFLCTCEATLACLSLITSVGLIYYSIKSPAGAELAWVQETVLRISGTFVILAVFFRMATIFPLLCLGIMSL